MITEINQEIIATVVSMTETEKSELLKLVAMKEELTDEMKTVSDAIKAALPVASADQVSALCALHRIEAEIPDGLKKNVDFRTTSEQDDQIDAAKEARGDELTARKDEILDECKVDGFRFASFKVRVSPKQTTKTLRFVKRAGHQKGGLIAALRAERA